MDSFFKVDGFFFAFLNRIANLFLLNILFLVTCLPIVTIGPAITALYQVSLKSVDDAYLAVFKDYMRAFKASFIQSSLLFLIQFISFSLVGLTLFFVSRLQIFVALPIFLVAAALLLYSPFPFVLIATQKKTLPNIIKSGLYLMLSHVAEAILLFIETVTILIVIPLVFPKVLFFVLSFGLAVVFYLHARTLKRIVSKALV